MRAVEITPDRTLETIEREPEPLREHEVRIAVSYAGICGSDLHNLEMPQIAPSGTVLGHEFSGVVVERGATVSELEIGTRVTVLPFEFCDVCVACLAGDPSTCVENWKTKVGSRNHQGAFAESVVAPASSAHLIPDGLSDADAALSEPIAVGIHGVAVSEVSPEEPVAVVGGGPIGISTTLALQARGFDSIVGVEPNEHRRGFLADLGIATTTPGEAAAAVPELLGAPAPAAVFDCSGHPSGPQTALSLLGRMGRLIMLGSTAEPAPLDFYQVVRDEIRMRGAVCYDRAEFQEAVDHLAAGAIPTDKLITAVRDLDRAQESFDDLMSGGSEHQKILLTP